MGHKLMIRALVLLLLLSWAAPVFAQEFDPERTGSISITLVDPYDGRSIEGAVFDVYRVADVDINTDRKLNYIYLDTFQACGIPLDDPALPAKLSAFVAEHPMPSVRLVTDETGAAACSGLPLGLYLVNQAGTVEGYSACTPFLVTVPMQSETGYVYDVNASPKADIVRLICITVKKVWNTDGLSEHPDSVTVRLLRDGAVVDTAVLNEENGWQILFRDLPQSDGYSIREVGVPKGYTATYAQNGWVFTVTNTPSLAQTGQLLWPIPVLAVLGMGLLILGFVLLRKREGTDA